MQVRQKLVNTRKRMEDILGCLQPNDDDEWYETTDALAQPLLSCYWSLWECGSGIVAEGVPIPALLRQFMLHAMVSPAQKGASQRHGPQPKKIGKATNTCTQAACWICCGAYPALAWA